MGGTVSLTVYKHSNVSGWPIEAARLHLLLFGHRILCFLRRSFPFGLPKNIPLLLVKTRAIDAMYTCYRTYLPNPRCSYCAP